uniref:Uncharacterized protein n=1 Tax=Physcomitrium patens TaxID=3218 RepID=A0A7I3ZA87_PHYPA
MPPGPKPCAFSCPRGVNIKASDQASFPSAQLHFGIHCRRSIHFLSMRTRNQYGSR